MLELWLNLFINSQIFYTLFSVVSLKLIKLCSVVNILSWMPILLECFKAQKAEVLGTAVWLLHAEFTGKIS